MAYFPDSPFKPEDFRIAPPAGAEAANVNISPADPLEESLARAHFLTGKAGVEKAFAGDPDFARPMSDYDTPMVDLIGQAARHFSDPEHGKAFTQAAIDEAAARRQELAEARQKQLRIKQADDALTALRGAALESPGDAEKTRLIDTSAAVIAGLKHHGLLTPEEATQRSRSWVEDYALQALKARPAKEQLELLGALDTDTSDPAASIFGLIPQEQRQRLAQEAERDTALQVIAAATAKADKWKRDITDASEDLRDLPRAAIESDPELDDAGRTTVLQHYDEAQGKAASFSDALRRFKDNEPFSPDNAVDRENADKLFRLLGGDETAAKVVLERTGIAPENAAIASESRMEVAPSDSSTQSPQPGEQKGWWDDLKEKILGQLLKPPDSDRDDRNNGDDGSELLPILLFLLLTRGGRGGKPTGLPKTGSPKSPTPPAERLPSGQRAKVDAPQSTPQVAPPLAKEIAEILGGLSNKEGERPEQSVESKAEDGADKPPIKVDANDDRSNDSDLAEDHERSLEEAARKVHDAAYELRKTALRQLPSAATLRGDELGEAAGIKDLRLRAKTYMRKNFVETNLKVINEQTGFEIGFNSSGLDKTVSRGEDLLRLIPALPEMLRKGTLISREEDHQSRSAIKAIYRFISAANIGENRTDVEIIVRETADGKFHYALSRSLKSE